MECKKYAVEYPEMRRSTFHEEENSTRLHLLSINGTPLDNRETITDLGVTFTSSLSFIVYTIRRIKSSALKSLALIIRHATDFKNPRTLQILKFCIRL